MSDFTWKDLTDGVDEASCAPINDIAHEVMRIGNALDISTLVSENTLEGNVGWVKFARWQFWQYQHGSLLLNLTQDYVGKKYNSLIEIELCAIDEGFHPAEGFVYRQIAGVPLTNKLCYVIEDDGSVIFYLLKGKYEYLRFYALSNSMGARMTYYSQETPVESLTPTGYIDVTSALGVTASTVDSKISAAITQTLNTEV